MSLQLAAQHLSSQGRGGDSTLVHMSPREVKSLSDLAMAHGGQLSINPQTGLPEAGFLSSILPMVAGAALVASGVGAPMAALMVGGGTAILTGSLEKGLMAGLGAYGGASLGGSLLASGAEPVAAGISEATAGQVATQTAEQAVAAQQVAEQAARSQALASQNAVASTTSSIPVAAPVAPFSSVKTVTPTINPTIDPAINPDHYSLMQNNSPAFQANVPSFMDKIKTMGSNISPSNLMKFAKEDPMAAASGVASLYSPEKKKEEEEKGDADMGQRYGFSMNPTGGQQAQPGQNPTTTPFPTPDIQGKERRYFSPSYTKLTPEQAKSMYGFAEGGTAQANPQPVEQPFPMPQYTNAGKQPPATSPADPPALLAFKQMQAQRAAQAQPDYTSSSGPAVGGAPLAKSDLAPTTVEGLYRTYLDRAPEQGGLDFWNKHFGSDVDASEIARFKHATIPELAENKRLAESTGGTLAREFNNYLRQTVSVPNQPQAPAESPPATGGAGQDSSSELLYDPIRQKYNKNPNFAAPAAESDEPAADAFDINKRPVVGYTAKGEKIYGEQKQYGPIYNFRAAGGLLDAYAGGGMTEPERMAAASSYVGTNTNYPQSQTLTNRFSTPTQIPMSEDVVLAGGGMSHLGDYSDGGRLLRGPGDGVSDSIPAMIGKKQPARLADGEFVVPARIVSELGNGSTEAGARKLYAMMDRIQKARGKTVGKGKVAKNSRSEKYLPA